MQVQQLDPTRSTRSGRPISIAYVDDSEDDQFLASEALRATGRSFDLRMMESAVEMWFMLNQRLVAGDDLPDVLVLDLKMPRVDGHQLLGTLMQDEIVNHVPVVVLTTSSDRRDIDRATSSGATRYMIKPSRFDDLVATFDSILDIGSR